MDFHAFFFETRKGRVKMADSRMYQWLESIPPNYMIYCIGEPITTMKDIHYAMRIAHHKGDDTVAMVYSLFYRASQNMNRLIFAIDIGEEDLSKAIWFDYTPIRFYQKEKHAFLSKIQEIMKEDVMPDLSGYMYGNLEQKVLGALHGTIQEELFSSIMEMTDCCASPESSFQERVAILTNFFAVLCPQNEKVRQILLLFFRNTCFLPMLRIKLVEIEENRLVQKGLSCDPDLKDVFQKWKAFFEEELDSASTVVAE